MPRTLTYLPDVEEDRFNHLDGKTWMVGITFQAYELMQMQDHLGRDGVWPRIKDMLTRKFYFEVFPQLFDGSWHCINLAYISRANYEITGEDYGIVGKIFAVQEKVTQIAKIDYDWMSPYTSGKGAFVKICSHCGNEWVVSPRGACSSCGASAQSALNLKL